MDKISLRKLLMDRRRAITAETRKQAAEQALRILRQSNLITSLSVVAAYWPLEREFDTKPIIEWLHQQSITCSLPSVTASSKPLVFRQFSPGDRLEKAQMF